MPRFVPADPARAAARLDDAQIHLWRLPYARRQRRTPFRALAAHYLGTDPDAIVFREGAHGRPELAGAASDWNMNWSHSGDHAVFAIARGLPVLGVDIEAARPRPRAMALSARFFDPRETAALASLPDVLQPSGFLKLWTAKEAVLKALGQGLRFGLDRVVFGLDDGTVTPLAFDAAAGRLVHWHLVRHDDAAAHVSLAWRGSSRQVLAFTPLP